MPQKSPQPSRASPSTAGASREILGNVAFQRAVERAASIKCIQAIRAGKLRVVQRDPHPSTPLRFTPRMDLIDDPITNTMAAVFELPGVKTADVTLQIRDGHLLVTGERRPPAAAQGALSPVPRTLPRNPVSAADSLAAGEMDMDDTDSGSPTVSVPVHELRYGAFYRALSVPGGMKESDVTAALQDGMLTVTWPKYPNGRNAQSVTPPVSPSINGTAAQ